MSHEAVLRLEYVCGWIGSCCCVFAGIISTYQVIQHWRQRYASYSIKKCVIRIIGFVVWYSIDAGFSMYTYSIGYEAWGAVLRLLRELYESTTVLAFVYLVIQCMGGKGEIRYHIETHAQHPKHPFLFGFHIARRHISEEGAFFRRTFGKIYRPGISMIITNLVGIVQFAFVLLFITVFHTVAIVVYTQYLGKEEPPWISSVAQVLKIVSTTVAMYQIFMLDETLEGNEGLKEKYEAMQPKLKFLFFKVPILLAIWIDGACKFGVKYFKSDENKEIFWNSFCISLLMFIFAIVNFWAFPPDQLIAVQDSGNQEHYFQIIQMLRDIQKFRELHQKRTACLQALVGFHNAATYLDLNGDGKIEKDELRYLCDTAGIERAEVDKLFADMGDQTSLDLRRFFPHWHPKEVVAAYQIDYAASSRRLGSVLSHNNKVPLLS